MENSKWFSPSARQWWCVTSVIISNMVPGFMMGYTACLLPALQANDSTIHVGIEKASWLASIVGPAIMIGSTLCCICSDRLGRRVAFALSLIPGIIGWSMIYIADSYLFIFIGRTLTAVTTGAIYTVGCFVIGEYTSPDRRGMFLNLKSTGAGIGITVTHILGKFVHWKTISIVALGPHVISFAMIFTLPESPSWLAWRKQYDKCEKEFFWLRGISEKSVSEVSELIEAQKERCSQSQAETSLKIKELFKKFTMKDFLKPLFICFVALAMMEASGRHFFPAYALQIMNDSLHSTNAVHYYTLCIDIIVTVSTAMSAVFVRVTKVRKLLFLSGIAALISLTLKCVCLFLMSFGVIPYYPWMITTLFVIYFAFINLGCAPVPLFLQSELFPLAHREFGMSVISVYFCCILTGTLKITPYLLLVLNVYGTFAVCGVITAISLIVLYFMLPETKGRTLQEIENYFRHGKYRIKDDLDDVYSKMIIKDKERFS